MLAISLPAAAQVYEAWVARYDNSGKPDTGREIALDDSGNVYVVGHSTGIGTSLDFMTIKYSPDGDIIWARNYNGPGNGDDVATQIFIDKYGYVYAAGTSFGSGTYKDYAIIKYKPDGDTAWLRRFNRPGDGVETLTGLVVDDSGNAYVTGWGTLPGLSYDYLTVKYSPSGDTLWVRTYDGPIGGADQAIGLAVDENGHTYVTGISEDTGGDFKIATIKYSPTGDTTWVRRHDIPGSASPFAVALDQNGNILITGSIHHGSPSTSDYLTVKYSPSGESLWTRFYDGPGNGEDESRAISSNDSGNVYVTGRSMGIGTGIDFATIKYSPAGDSMWVRRYNGSDNSADFSYMVLVDENANVYVTGFASDSISGDDCTTIKYSPEGNLLWIESHNGPSNAYDVGLSIAVDDSENVYVTGASYDSTLKDDFVTIKYSPCVAITGDANSSGDFSVADIISAVNYYFNKPGWPVCGSNSALCWLSGSLCRGDWNGSGTISIGDIIHGVNNIFNKPGDWTPIATGTCCLPAP